MSATRRHPQRVQVHPDAAGHRLHRVDRADLSTASSRVSRKRQTSPRCDGTRPACGGSKCRSTSAGGPPRRTAKAAPPVPNRVSAEVRRTVCQGENAILAPLSTSSRTDTPNDAVRNGEPRDAAVIRCAVQKPHRAWLLVRHLRRRKRTSRNDDASTYKCRQLASGSSHTRRSGPCLHLSTDCETPADQPACHGLSRRPPCVVRSRNTSVMPGASTIRPQSSSEGTHSTLYLSYAEHACPSHVAEFS
jgi:hypothetical protein